MANINIRAHLLLVLRQQPLHLLDLLFQACSLVEFAILDLHRLLQDAVLTLRLQQLDLCLQVKEGGNTALEKCFTHTCVDASQRLRSVSQAHTKM